MSSPKPLGQSVASTRREKLRSHNSAHRAFAAFVNKTNKHVALEWLDFQGNHTPYKEEMRPNESMQMNTYVGHPWVFYESELRHPLVVLPDRRRVYMPQKWELGPIVYHEVHIVNPYLSLKQLCLNHLHRRLIKDCKLKSNTQFADALKSLESSLTLLKQHSDQLKKMEIDRHNKNIAFYESDSDSNA